MKRIMPGFGIVGWASRQSVLFLKTQSIATWLFSIFTKPIAMDNLQFYNINTLHYNKLQIKYKSITNKALTNT